MADKKDPSYKDSGDWSFNKTNPADIEHATKEYGGSTTFLQTGVNPTKGTSVSLGGFEQQVPLDDFGVSDIHRFTHSPEHIKALTARPNRAVGTWTDVDKEGTPTAYLDVSRVFGDTPRSNRLARISTAGSNQMGAFNLETFTTEYNPTHPDVLKRAGGNVELNPGESERWKTSEAPIGTEVVYGTTTASQKFSRGRGRKKAVVPQGQGTFIFTGSGSQLQPPPTPPKK